MKKVPISNEGPELQGEGNTTADRRYRESVKKFIDAGRVEPAAREATPKTAEQAQEMEQAEKRGRGPARR